MCIYLNLMILIKIIRGFIRAEPLISEMEAVINKTRAEILHGISAEELEQLITLIAKLEHNIIELQAKG
ncbi:hypothetical protein AWE72_20295 [Escherichia coli]|nr:hypothetical protein AWE72_20295 [Escherichia coli]